MRRAVLVVAFAVALLPSVRVDAAPKRSPVTATYPGFELLDGAGSRVFVELDGRPEVATREGDRALTFVLKNTRVRVRNNTNSLDLTYFDTPVATARLVPHGGDLYLEIRLRKPAHHAYRLVDGDDGAVLLEVDFPPEQDAAPNREP